MADRPILMSAPMVRALLAGNKTQTRRIVKSPPASYCADHMVAVDGGGVARIPFYDANTEPPTHDWMVIRCPYGAPGDRLWVRETFSADWCEKGHPVQYRADGELDIEMFDAGVKWRPSIFMPRWASRITLELTDVRVQRVQDISYEDAIAEGWRRSQLHSVSDPQVHIDAARDWYMDLWNSINGRSSWEANPWAWALTFRVVKGEGNG